MNGPRWRWVAVIAMAIALGLVADRMLRFAPEPEKHPEGPVQDMGAGQRKMDRMILLQRLREEHGDEVGRKKYEEKIQGPVIAFGFFTEDEKEPCP